MPCLVLLNKTGNTGGTGFRVAGGDDFSLGHTDYEMLTEHLSGAMQKAAAYRYRLHEAQKSGPR